MSLYDERLDRTRAAVALEPVDRVPFSYLGNAVNAQFTGTSLADYCNDMDINRDTNLKGIQMVGDIDTSQNTIFSPTVLPTLWFTKVLIPGKELPENELWQMEEKELVTQDDYDEILEDGYEAWFGKFYVERLGEPMTAFPNYPQQAAEATQRFAEEGIPVINGGMVSPPFEAYCGGRSMIEMMTDDLIEIPDKLEKVFDLTQEYNIKAFEAQHADPATRPLGVWVGGWRGTPGMLSNEMFERFSWKYMKELVDVVISLGIIPILHLDSNWTLGLEHFRELPKGKCIMALDGDTDILKAKEVVGDRICIMGDVRAPLLALATPQDVTDFCKKRISEMGPTGFILSSGCDIPYNAKLENTQAMVRSVHEK